MRLLVALIVALAVLATTARARASEARRALDDANAALAAEPPRTADAREALGRATKAADDPPAVGEAYLLLGQLDEADGAYPQAIVDDRAAVDAAPNTRWALRAVDRIDWIRARSEGDFEPLRRIEKVRRDPGASSDPAVIDALARDLESFPPGTVRVESRMLVAEAWLGRIHRPDAAIDELREVTADPKADPLTARLAERELVDALVESGRIDDAVAEARSHVSRLDPRFVRGVGRLTLRRSVRRASIAVLVAFGVLALVGIGRAAARKTLGGPLRELRKLALVAVFFVGFVAIAGGFLASRYEAGNAEPFLVLGAIVLPLLLVARLWSAAGSQKAPARAARALLCGMTIVAAAFMLLEAMNPQYLEGFGL
ncbi:MAG TPA: hypothetical protein VGG39_05285 [Polyangiaceae bacterium]|jgi:hypothetical protein